MGGPSTEDERIEQMLLPLLLLAFGAAAGATLASPPISVPPAAQVLTEPAVSPVDSASGAAPDGYLRLKVADVVLAEGAARSAVLLTGFGERFVLPLFVTSEAGEKIQNRLDSFSFDTPPAFARADEFIVRVELREDDGEPVGRVVVSQDGAERPLDATLDEALSVALARGATIWVAQGLVEQQAFETDALFPLVGKTASHLRPPTLL